MPNALHAPRRQAVNAFDDPAAAPGGGFAHLHRHLQDGGR